MGRRNYEQARDEREAERKVLPKMYLKREYKYKFGKE